MKCRLVIESVSVVTSTYTLGFGYSNCLDTETPSFSDSLSEQILSKLVWDTEGPRYPNFDTETPICYLINKFYPN